MINRYISPLYAPRDLSLSSLNAFCSLRREALTEYRRKSIPGQSPSLPRSNYPRLQFRADAHAPPRFYAHIHTSFLAARALRSGNDRGRFSHLQRTHRGLFRGTNRSATNYRSAERALTAASLTCNHRDRGGKSFHCH